MPISLKHCLLGGWILCAPALAPVCTEAQETGTSQTVRAGDLLQIRVWPDQDQISGEFPVEDSGVIYVPVVGRVEVAGRRVEEIRQELVRLFGENLQRPVVTVIPRFRVSVLGGVQRPGLYLADPTFTLFDLIGTAGGFNSFAVEDRIRIVRDGKVIEVDGRDASSDNGSVGRVRIRSGDRIIVPEDRPFNFQALAYVLQAATLVLTIVNLTR